MVAKKWARVLHVSSILNSAGSPAPGNIVLHSPVYTSDKKDWSPKSQSQQKSGHTAARDDV